MTDFPLILKCDAQGHPRAWITHERAAYYYSKDRIEWSLGENGYTIYGGVSRMTGQITYMYFDPILAIKGRKIAPLDDRVPLNKKTLFRRDHYLCAYCGNDFKEEYFRKSEDGILQMEHVKPVAQGGLLIWENLVTSCRGCNTFKADRTPEQAGMELLYVPYVPTRAEYLILTNRKILGDQMDFLKARVPATSRVHKH